MRFIWGFWSLVFAPSIIPVTLNTDYPLPAHLLIEPLCFVAFILVVDARVR